MKHKICLIIDFFLINLNLLSFFSVYFLAIFEVDLSIYLYVFFPTLILYLVELSFSYYNNSFYLKNFKKPDIEGAKKGISPVIKESVATFIISTIAIIKIVLILFLSLFYYYIFHQELSLFLKIILPISFIVLFLVELWICIAEYMMYKKGIHIINK